MVRATDVVQVTLPSHPKFLPLIRALVERGAEVAGFALTEQQHIALGVTEGVTNVMRHGYGGSTEGRIDLRLAAPSGEFRIEIEDDAPYIEPETIRSRDLADVRPGGLGVHVMQATMDTVDYRRNERGGTTLTRVKRVASSGSPPSGSSEEAT